MSAGISTNGKWGNLMLGSISRRGLVVAILLTLVCMNLPLAKAEEFALSDWTSPTLSDLYSVFMVGSSDGWAVGEGGAIVHWNGTEWANFTSPTNATLFSVSMVGSDDGWAVGMSGTVIHWNGTDWQIVSSPTVSDLHSVCMVNADDGWAVGFGGTIIRWNGTGWTRIASEIIDVLNSVSMVDSTDGWAVGNGGIFIHWNGTVWLTGPPGSPGGQFLFPECVYMLSADDGWAVGLGAIWHWNGTGWSYTSWGLDIYESVFFVDPNDGWMVGSPNTFYVIGSPGAVFHWDGTGWASVTSPTTNPIRLSSVFMVNASDGWIVGESGTIIRWNGIQWVVPEFSTTTFAPLMVTLTLAAIILIRVPIKKTKDLCT